MRPHGIPRVEAPAAAAAGASLAARRSPSRAAQLRRSQVVAMEEENLGVGDGCGEQTRGATASAAGHGLGRAVTSVGSLQLQEAE